jgi:cell division protease FtsH
MAEKADFLCAADLWMVSDLLKHGVKVEAKPEEEQSFLMSIFVSWFPMLLLIGVWVFLHAPDAGRWQGRGVFFRQEQGASA